MKYAKNYNYKNGLKIRLMELSTYKICDAYRIGLMELFDGELEGISGTASKW